MMAARSKLVWTLAMLGCRAEPEPIVTPPVPIVVELQPKPAPTVVELALETGWGCALRSDGSVHCWGELGPTVGLRDRQWHWEVAGALNGVNAIDISSSPDRLCYAQRDGLARCLDSSERVRREYEFQDVVQIEVGDFVCTRSSAGAVQCVDPETDIRDVRVVLDNALDLRAEGSTVCALDESGIVWCWYMKLVGKKRLELRPYEGAQFDGASAFASFGIEWVGPSFCCSREGAIWCASEAPQPEFEPMPELKDITAFTGTFMDNCAIHATGKITCSGDNRWAQIGDGSSVTKPGRFEVEGVPNPTIIANSASYACAASQAEVRCWGTQLAGPNDESVVEEHSHDLNATGVASDGSLTCATNELDGLVCWGMAGDPVYTLYGDSGAHPAGILGVARPRPVDLDIGPLKKMQGGCLLDQAGELVCGHFGEPDQRSETVGSGSFVVEHRASGVTDFVRARWGSCWIRRGSLECFDSFGGPKRDTPKLSRPVAMAGLGTAACVLHGGGKVSCFDLFQLDDRSRTTPVRVGKLDGIVAISSAGFGKFAALDAQGQVWEWVYDLHGKTRSIRDLEIRAEEADEIVAGGETLCIRSAEQVDCEMVEPEVYDDIVQLTAGHDFFCVRRGDDGSIACEGHNDYGQLGAPPATLMLTPTSIEFEP